MTRVLGPEHPATLVAMNNLATVLAEHGDLDRAEALQSSVRATMTRRLGDDHHHTLTSVENLAHFRGKRGDFSGAAALQSQVSEAKTRALGSEHHQTLTAMAKLSDYLRQCGNAEEASSVEERAALAHLGRRAAALFSAGDTEGALKLEEQVLKAREVVFGDDNPWTTISMNNVAGMLASSGQFERAEVYQERVLSLLTRHLGHDHLRTKSAAESLAAIRAKIGSRPF